MSEVWLAAPAILGGLVGLVWSADRFVAGSAALALQLGLSKLVIGLTIVSLGTSAPEIMVAISAGLKGAGDLAVGNALGSNLANIGLVLGITALVAPLPTQRHLLSQEIPALLAVTALAGFMLYDARLTFAEGLTLVALLVPLLWLTVRSKKSHHGPEEEDVEIRDYTTLRAAIWFSIGLAALLVSSEILVWGARRLALAAGVSPLVIGLTVVAVGTSLPELAASIISVLRGHFDLALGNIIGSNVFNILAVMSVPGIIATTQMEDAVFSRDYLAMLTITLMLVAAIAASLWRHPIGARLGRRLGLLLLASYTAYYWLLFHH
ncbi:calcium/sodium antiporter [Microbulbifer rhizosphaerae]|uniref:Cation:H+ antiporter n=1 Tax=Microbulbifer rhizosphaerae TaxID=1562603 RepID=A0A7W4Z8M4_9GAMM|nr:calcium/sodium antiporter [Microbulbifer rhizosphaerae]MBB3059369.1 cation:H+ antiporter [Microbulbifer rhizosphaerae]